jgi:hypothetical protein
MSRVPWQNRVTPAGELIAVPARGTLTGNRGVLHDRNGAIVRRSQVRRWISCRLEFRARRRVVMTPNRYTHLFFLDEATALAAGHRPCAECRHADYLRFRQCWAQARGLPELPAADQIDEVLHGERMLSGGNRVTWPADGATLPDGVFVQRQGEAWLVAAGTLRRWTPDGYADRLPLPGGQLAVLTPRSAVAAINAGYRPLLHPTVAADSPAAD